MVWIGDIFQARLQGVLSGAGGAEGEAAGWLQELWLDGQLDEWLSFMSLTQKGTLRGDTGGFCCC